MSAANGPLDFSDALSAEDEETLTQQLSAFNLAWAGASWSAPQEPRAVHISVRDAAGRLVGGLIGTTHAIPYWLSVSVVWVDEAVRRRGIGSELMRRAEEIARQRGCCYARLATSHYQAPDFYRRLGYREYGRLDDCPPGETVFYFRKNLV